MQERLRQNREAILQAAKQLISQGGIKDAQIQAMADLAGVSNGLVYRYFDNKNHIIIEVLSEAIMREMLDECLSTATTSGYTPRQEAMTQMISSLTERGSAGTASMFRDMARTGPGRTRQRAS